MLSQVVLSFGIPFALVPLVLLTRRRDLMAELVNRRTTTAVAAVIAALIIAPERLPDLADDHRGSQLTVRSSEVVPAKFGGVPSGLVSR